jgi:hypothetical protein
MTLTLGAWMVFQSCPSRCVKLGYMQAIRRLQRQHENLVNSTNNILCAFFNLRGYRFPCHRRVSKSNSRSAAHVPNRVPSQQCASHTLQTLLPRAS